MSLSMSWLRGLTPPAQESEGQFPLRRADGEMMQLSRRHPAAVTIEFGSKLSAQVTSFKTDQGNSISSDHVSHGQKLPAQMDSQADQSPNHSPGRRFVTFPGADFIVRKLPQVRPSTGGGPLHQ